MTRNKLEVSVPPKSAARELCAVSELLEAAIELDKQQLEVVRVRREVKTSNFLFC